MDFRRGRQMIVHDPNLNNRNTTPPTMLTPPVAFRRWTVHPQNSPGFIIQGVARQIRGGIDALHFMGHGNRGFIAVGRGTFSSSNADLFAQLRGHVRVIVFFSCLVAGDNRGWYRGHPVSFGQHIAANSGARVVMARETQMYSWNSTNIIEFGQWEGPVDVYEPSGGWSEYQAHNPFRTERPLRLEQLIFG